jgi:hypothetical protein
MGIFRQGLEAVMRHQSRANEILRVRVGSYLYGTETPTSDIDYYSVWVPSPDMYVGLKAIDQVHEDYFDEQGRKCEITRYPLHFFVRHLLKCNPNMLEVMYADSSSVVHSTPMGDRLRESVNLFLSSEVCYKTFRGYASEQKRKLVYKLDRLNAFMGALKTLDEWIALGHKTLPEVLTLSSEYSEIGEWREFNAGFDIADTRVKILKTLDDYGWRKELILKYGYDVKFAANLIRVNLECIDLFSIGRIRLPLSGSGSVRDIRSGKWTLKQVIDTSNDLEKIIDAAYAKTTIPKESDEEAIHKLMVELHHEFWNAQKAVA